MSQRFSDYTPKIRKRAFDLASKLYDPKSLDLSDPKNGKSRDQIEGVLVLYAEEAKRTLKDAAEEAKGAFERARAAAVEAARYAEDAQEDARESADEAEADEPAGDRK